MKILCIADIHGDTESLPKVNEFIKDNSIDLVLILGDFPGYGVFRDNDQSIAEAKSILNGIWSPSILALPGNCDPPEILDLFNERGINLHEQVKDVGGVRIAGFGSSNSTPFGTPFEMGEEEIYQKLKGLMNDAGEDRLILALHCPPKDTNCDRTSGGTHVGSTSIRKIIEEFQPTLVVCSHIHESGGSLDRIGKSQVANIGMLSQGNIGIIETAGGIMIELRNLK